MSFITASLLALSLASSAYTSPLSTYPHASSQRSSFVAPLIEEVHPYGTVNNSYIVMLKEGFSSSVHLSNHINFLQAKHAESPLMGENSGLRHVYDDLGGYAGYFHDDVIDQVRALPEVQYVERDHVVQASKEVLADPSLSTQFGSPWGLARISHLNKLTLGTFTKYIYDSSGGEGVDAYIIDTGVDITHYEFKGRAAWGKTIPQNDVDKDMNGHGTHCAGTIASETYGVAKKAHVIAVKVLGSNGSGTMSDVIAGVLWASNDAKQKNRKSVANMSLGGGKSPTLDTAVNKAIDAGTFFAVAAGNENGDACRSSPAASEKALTVGASTLADERAYFSNHGSCVDILGPGLNILSTWPGNGTNTISGTSMASPHAAGLAAYLLSIYPSTTFNPKFSPGLDVTFEDSSEHPFSMLYRLSYAALPRFISEYLPSPAIVEAAADMAPTPPKTLTPAQLKQAILALGLRNKLTDKLPSGTPNLLLFNNATIA